MNAELANALITMHKSDLLDFMGLHPHTISQALQIALSDQQDYAWRAAWVLGCCMVNNDERVQPFVGQMVEALEAKPEGYTRELLKVLMKLDLPEYHQGKVFDICSAIWLNPRKSVGLRVVALKMLASIAKRQPEILPELITMLDDVFVESLSRGAIVSVLRIRENLINHHKRYRHLTPHIGDTED